MGIYIEVSPEMKAVQNIEIARDAVFFRLAFHHKEVGASPELCYRTAVILAAEIFRSGGKGGVFLNPADNAESLIVKELERAGINVVVKGNLYYFNFNEWTTIESDIHND